MVAWRTPDDRKGERPCARLLILMLLLASLLGSRAPRARRGRSGSERSTRTAASRPASPSRIARRWRWPWTRSMPRGGLLGRKVEVLFRDDKGNPAEAIKHAQELVAGEKVHLLAGTYLSNVGLAVSDFAKMHKTLFLAAEPLSEAITWSQGHRYTFRVRPNTYSQGRMLAERAATASVPEMGRHRPELRVRPARVGDVLGAAQGVEAGRAGGRRALADAGQAGAGGIRHRAPEPATRGALRVPLRERLAGVRARSREARALREDVCRGDSPRASPSTWTR